MHALVGIASQGPGALHRVREGCLRLSRQAHLLAVSRPWQAPATPPQPGGVVTAAHVDVAVSQYELRAWLWDLEGDGHDVQVELLAGRQEGRWRWALDLDRDGAWLGPLADIEPTLRLPGGNALQDELALHPHAGALPLQGDTGVAAGRSRRRPQAGDLRVGRTWGARPPRPRTARREAVLRR